MAGLKLIITSPGQGAREVEILGSASVGRSTENTIRIEDPSVARYHAVIEAHSNEFWLSDLGTANGTLINGTLLSAQHQLKKGDAISLGNTRISVGEEKKATIAAADNPANTSATNSPSTPPSPEPIPDNSGSSVSTLHLVAAGASVFVILGIVAWALIPRTPPPLPPSPTYIATSTVTPSTTPIETPTPRPKGSPSAPDEQTEQMVKLLSASLSGQSNYYVFDPEMISQIAARTSEYKQISSDLSKYDLHIKRAFGNLMIPTLIGYSLAMSRSKFGQVNTDGVGIWQIPRNIATEHLLGDENPMNLDQPERSAQIAAEYYKELSRKFPPEDFVYAIACYGWPASRAGEIRQKLEEISPAEKRNFWKMCQRGIVPREGADRVVCFFAAGIVGENPSYFNLPGKPWSQR